MPIPWTQDLFDAQPGQGLETLEPIVPGAWILRGHALDRAPALIESVAAISAAAPFRHLVTPGGFRMSVAMTNCGELGWISDRRGYRYQGDDPETGKPWPAMPELLRALAREAASEVGFEGFDPDACLINRYEPGARLTLHQDRDEHDMRAPIVSVSLGLPATFLFGGDARADRTSRHRLEHGDVVVWGGPARMHHHGVAPLKAGHNPLLGAYRINLTFRRAGLPSMPAVPRAV